MYLSYTIKSKEKSYYCYFFGLRGNIKQSKNDLQKNEEVYNPMLSTDK